MQFAYSITRSTPDAEEVVNDVFIAIWERHQDLLGLETLKSYLFRAESKVYSQLIDQKLKTKEPLEQ